MYSLQLIAWIINSSTYHLLLKFNVKGVVSHLHNFVLNFLPYPRSDTGRGRSEVVGKGRMVIVPSEGGVVGGCGMKGECLRWRVILRDGVER